MNIILRVVFSVLLLAFIIFFHELGHFLVGKLLGFCISGFSIGFGPKLFSFKRNGTEYALRLIPFGGSCQFVGEDGNEDFMFDPPYFNDQPVWKRFLTVFAGPFMNILLAFLIGFTVFLATPIELYGDNGTGIYTIEIKSVKEGSPAEKAGIQAGDIIKTVNGRPCFENGMTDKNTLDHVYSILQYTEGEVVFDLKRDNTIFTLRVYRDEVSNNKFEPIGISIGPKPVAYDHLNVIEAAEQSGLYMWQVTEATGKAIGKMFKNGLQPGDLSGVVGTVAVMVDYSGQGLINLVYISIILSLSLGVFNLLPIPALDGGRLLFLIIEAIKRKPLNRNVEMIINGIGFLLLMILMVVVTATDIIGLFK